MYSFKNHPLTSKKHQDKIVHHAKNSSCIRTADRNDNIIGMVLKNLKPKINSTDSTLKSADKNSELKSSHQSNCISHQMQSPSKHPDKRKDERGNNSNRKKIRIDNSAEELEPSTESVGPKKQNKFKSAFPKTYICKYCCRRFHSVEQLRQHSAEHGSKPSHICHLCNHQTASFSALMTHYLKHSGSKGKELEKIYAKSKADFSNIQFNIFSRPKSSFKCNKCKLSFSSKSKYDNHNCLAIAKKSEYNCAYCGHISSTVEEYRNHIQNHSETPFVCPYCKYKAMSKKQLDVHRELCKKRRKLKDEFKCNKCTVFQGKSKKELNHHLKTCEKNNLIYTCVKCLSEFHEKKSYDDHLLGCKIKEKQKSVIKKSVKYKKKLKESVAAKNKLVCCVCESICSSKPEHEEHERQCLAEMANKPNEKTSSSMRSSTGETSKLFQNNKMCSDQNDIVREKKSLNTDIHNTRRSARLVRRKSSYLEDDEIKKPKVLKIKISKKSKLLIKPKCRKGRQSKNPNNSFLCNYCDFTFCSKSTLLRHKRMHSGNPWYICQYCGKFFFRKDVYIRHEENVHKKSSKTVFCCYYCKLCFNESSLLKEHVVAVHKGSAFLPIKQKLSGKSNGERNTKPDIKIKQEPDDKKVEIVKSKFIEPKVDSAFSKSTVSETASSSTTFATFKCSICFYSFENAAAIENHMHTHVNNTSSSNKTNEVTKSPLEKSFDVHEPATLSKDISELNDSVNDSNVMLDSVISTASLEQTKDVCVTDNRGTDDNTNNDFSEMDELIQNTELSTEPVECKLCSKQFPNKKLYEAHRKTPHKIVDWYRCLVCTACGPKQEMLDHMFMHMYKVGSFVVSNNGDYDSIIALQIDQQKNDRRDTSTCNKKQDPTLSENVAIVSEDELPPLREYGICPCINGRSAPNDEENEALYLEREDIEHELDKNVETQLGSQESLDSCTDMSTERDIPQKETVVMPVQNNSITLDTEDVNSESEIEEKEILKLDETNSSEIPALVKENFMPDFKSDGISVDCNQSEGFSHLRYLLQSPSSRHSSENKVSIYPFSQLDTSDFAFDKTKHSNPQSPNLDVTSVVSKNDLNFESSKQNDISNNETSYKIPLMQENNQSINTCLKFDVNQSRSEFSENLSTSSQKAQNCAEIEKNENIFKSCPPQSTILDFSDLIHHSFENSSPSEDNLFSYATTSKQVALHSNVDMREEVHTPDCTDMANYDSTGVHSSVKCESCNLLIEDHNEQVNHKCSPEQLANADILCQYKSKSTFQSLACVENQNKIISADNSPDKKVNVATPEKSGIFICSLCSKMTISETELLRHQKTEHVQSVHNSPHSNECTKCHRTFTDIGELMKHSLTCLRTYFLKNNVVGDSVSSSESLQTLLRKDEPKTNFSNFSLNSSLPFNTVSTDLSHQTSENILKHSFNS